MFKVLESKIFDHTCKFLPTIWWDPIILNNFYPNLAFARDYEFLVLFQFHYHLKSFQVLHVIFKKFFIINFRRNIYWQGIESSWRLVLWCVKWQWRLNNRAFSYGSETKWRETLPSRLQRTRPMPGRPLSVLPSIQWSGLFAK